MPSFRSVSFNTGTGTSFTMTEPTGATDGDILSAMILIADTFSGFTIDGTWSSPLFNTDVGPFTYKQYDMRRSGAPALGVSWTTSRYYEWVLIATSGAVSSGTFIDASAAGTPTTGVNVDPPAITTTTANTIIYALGTHWAGYGGGTSGPAGWGGTVRFNEAGYDQIVASLEVAAVGANNPGTFGNSLLGASDSMCGFTFAIASEASGGGGGDAPAPVDHSSTLSFPGLCRRPQNDNGRWTRGQGGLWVPRRAA